MKKITKKYLAAFTIIAVFAVSFSLQANEVSFNNNLVNAAEQGSLEIVKAIITKGGEVNQRGKFETTALHRAAYNGYDEIVSELIAAGADVNAKDFGGATPLHMAARTGDPDTIRSLIKNGADINSKDGQGFTPLHRAVVANNTGSSLLLASAGANVNDASRSGNAPIFAAIQNDNARIAEELIINGANLNVKNAQGYNPIDFANTSGSEKVAQIISQNRADIMRKRALEKNDVIIFSDQKEFAQADIPEFLKNGSEKVESFVTDDSKVSVKRVSTNAFEEVDIEGIKERQIAKTLEDRKALDALALKKFNEMPRVKIEEVAFISNEPVAANAKSFNLAQNEVKNIIASAEEPVVNIAEEGEVTITRLGATDLNTQPVDMLKIASDRISAEPVQTSLKEEPKIDPSIVTTSITAPILEKEAKAEAEKEITKQKIAKQEGSSFVFDDSSLPASIRLRNYLNTNAQTEPQEQPKILTSAEEVIQARKAPVIYADNAKKAEVIFVKEKSVTTIPVPTPDVATAETSPVLKAAVKPAIIEKQIEVKKINVDEIASDFNSDLVSKTNKPASLRNITGEENKYNYITDRIATEPTRTVINNVVEKEEVLTEVRPLKTTPVYNNHNEGNLIDNKASEIVKLEKPKSIPAVGNSIANVKSGTPKPFDSNAGYDKSNLVRNIQQFYNKGTVQGEYDISELQEKRFKSLDIQKPYLVNDDSDSYEISSRKQMDEPEVYEAEVSVKSLNKSFDEYESSNLDAEVEKKIEYSNEPNSSNASLDNNLNMPASLRYNSYQQYTEQAVDTESLKKANDADAAEKQKELTNLLDWGDEKTETNTQPISLNPVKAEPKSLSLNAPKAAPKVSSIPAFVAKETSNIAYQIPNTQADNAASVVERTAVMVEPVSVNNEESIKVAAKKLPSTTQTATKTIQKAEPIKTITYEDNSSLNGGIFSIVGPFASIDDSISSFNSFSTNSGIIYPHRVTKSENDNNFYLAIGALDNEGESKTICGLYPDKSKRCVFPDAGKDLNLNQYKVYISRNIYSFIGEFTSASDAKNYYQDNVNITGVEHNIARAGDKNLYLLRLGPLQSGIEAKTLCEEYSKPPYICKVAAQ